MSALPITDINTMMVRNHIGDDVNAVYQLGSCDKGEYWALNASGVPYFTGKYKFEKDNFNRYGFNSPNAVQQRKYWGNYNVYFRGVGTKYVYMDTAGNMLGDEITIPNTWPEHHDLGAWRGYDKDWFCLVLSSLSFVSVSSSAITFAIVFTNNKLTPTINCPDDLTSIKIKADVSLCWFATNEDGVLTDHGTTNAQVFDVALVDGVIPRTVLSLVNPLIEDRYFSRIEVTFSIDSASTARRASLQWTFPKANIVLPPESDELGNFDSYDSSGNIITYPESDSRHIPYRYWDSGENAVNIGFQPAYIVINPTVCVSTSKSNISISMDGGPCTLKVSGIYVTNELRAKIEAGEVYFEMQVTYDNTGYAASPYFFSAPLTHDIYPSVSPSGTSTPFTAYFEVSGFRADHNNEEGVLDNWLNQGAKCWIDIGIRAVSANNQYTVLTILDDYVFASYQGKYTWPFNRII